MIRKTIHEQLVELYPAMPFEELCACIDQVREVEGLYDYVEVTLDIDYDYSDSYPRAHIMGVRKETDEEVHVRMLAESEAKERRVHFLRQKLQEELEKLEGA